jgi:hypothetical protein
MNKKIMIAISLISYFFMIVLNSLANILPINGLNTGQISDMYPNLFVPAGITFSIWGIIYIFLFLFVISLIKQRNVSNFPFIFVALLYISSNLLNGIWILAWHYQIIFLSLIIMLVLLSILIKLYLVFKSLNIDNTFSIKVLKWTISLYLGWISVATIANITAFLVSIEWTRFGLSESFWTILILSVVLILTLIMLLKEHDLIFSSVVLWSFVGILLKRLSDTLIYKEIIITTQIAIFMVIMNMLLIILKKKGINLI